MAQIKKDTSLRKAILQAAITGQLISDIGGESDVLFSNEKKSKTKLDSEADLPLASRVSKRNSVVSDSERTTPSPRGYAPKTPNEFASFENQNSVSERSERPTLPETGKQLLDRIIEERNNKLLADWEEALKKNPKAKKPAPVVASEIDEEEIPFEIPENWCWCRLGDLVPFGQCENADPNDIKEDAWILDLEDIEKNSGKILQFKTKKEVDSKSTKHIFRKDYVLYSKLRPYLNKCVIAPKDGYCTSEILPLDFGKHIFNKYAQKFLMSPYFVDYTDSLSFGVKMPRLGTEDGKKALVPLPPLSVQNAIVAKLEQVLPLVDAYENALLQKEELKSALPDKVKKAILQEAITGQLTETWRKSATIKESGKQLLDRIIEERNAKALADWEEALKKNPKAKKPVPVVASEIDEEEIPFEVPESWCWCHLGEIFKVTMGQSPEGSNVGEEKEGMEFHQGKIFFTDKYIATSNQKTSEITKIAEPGSILLCMRAPVGKVNITDRQICIGRGLSSIVPLGEIALEWAFHLFETLESDFIDKSTGSTFKAITGDVVKEQLIPLPPLEEQQEIVKKVEELLELCK